MYLEVAFTPALLHDAEAKACVVIDFLRLTSSVATLFARGLEEAVVAASIEEARKLAYERPGWLLCGEERGLPPEGFDYGNSPTEFDRLDLAGRRAVLVSTNGTPALARAAICRETLAGSLLNRASVAAAIAQREGDVALLCAGDARGGRFSLEDAFCAGAFVEALQSQQGVDLRNGAVVALRLYRSYRGSANAMLGESEHAAALRRIGLNEDLEFCARRDRFDVVPRLSRGADGTLRLTAD